MRCSPWISTRTLVSLLMTASLALTGCRHGVAIGCDCGKDPEGICNAEDLAYCPDTHVDAYGRYAGPR